MFVCVIFVKFLSVIFHFIKEAAPWLLLTRAGGVVVKHMVFGVSTDPDLSSDSAIYKL